MSGLHLYADKRLMWLNCCAQLSIAVLLYIMFTLSLDATGLVVVDICVQTLILILEGDLLSFD